MAPKIPTVDLSKSYLPQILKAERLTDVSSLDSSSNSLLEIKWNGPEGPTTLQITRSLAAELMAKLEAILR